MKITLGPALAATLLLMGVLLVSTAAVLASWASLSAAVEERDAKADLLARSLSASRRMALSSRVEPQGDPFIAAESQTLAAAQVDALVRSVADEEKGAVLSSRSEAKPEDDGPAGHIEAEAVIEGQNDALQAILMRLEGSDPVILVDSLTIAPAETADDAAPASPQDPRLRMTLTLGAYWKAPPH